MNKREALYKELLEDKAVELWSNDKWNVGLEVWDNGVIHFFISDEYICANGIMYDEDGDCIKWDWTPFPNYVCEIANRKWVKAMYFQYKKEFTPHLCY